VARKSRTTAPLLIRIAALATDLWRRRGSRGPAAVAAGKGGGKSLDAMTPRAFEALVGEAFRGQGYLIVETPEGVEMTVRKGRETFLVQCKHWKTRRVDVEMVRELFVSMKTYGAAGGFIVASGRFSREAQAFSKSINVRLIDGTVLEGLLAKARPAD
jgi:restriction system protein